MEDIEEEVNYWTSSVVCYVLGTNPPLLVFEGFCRRMWKNLGIDKMAIIGHGIFIVRFVTVEQRNQVLNNGILFFDKKPLVMKSWSAQEDFRKESFQKVPIWVQLSNLDLKYWGERSLYKIVSQIGKPLQIDPITKAKEKLNFARVVIEVSVDQDFPHLISFVNEQDKQMDVIVQYEWKPSLCSVCKGLGHEDIQCQKQQGKQVWVPKNTGVDPTKKAKAEIDKDGFQLVIGKGKKNDGEMTKERSGVRLLEVTKFSFQVLGEASSGVSRDEQDRAITEGGGAPLVRRADLWEDLRCLRSMSPWVLLGDFNATINIEERVGVKVRTLHSEAFRECMIDCELEDVHYNGCFHTWSNNQDPPDRIVAKLDRVLGNST
ncbi:uncharacterized protein LOC133825776 [Humulus lupulus]|uniref:uncharacterized protein LOC133825776 n=1 Tax=Humulus lupulus TaxID=3486 RepID=UPI002B401CA3|nr:uncharacterized protein LOC133825776 [Humulus lupulus]